MLKKIFGKNKQQEKLEIPQDWNSFFCRIEDKPASIRLNLALSRIAPVEYYDKQIWFSVKFMNPDENGFTTREEYEMINAIEDTILDSISSNNSIILAGAIKTDGRLDLYIYAQSTKGVEDIVNSTMQTKFDNYQYALDTKQDREWKDYYNFLYPSPYEFQTIQNRKVIMQLEQNGDNPEVKRKVDHWINFNDQSNLKIFIDSVIEKGYDIINEQQNDREEFRYSVNIAREDVTVFPVVNNYVWELVELASENNGIYGGWGCPIAK